MVLSYEVHVYVRTAQPGDLEVHECNEAPLSNGMRVMEQNFFFLRFDRSKC